KTEPRSCHLHRHGRPERRDRAQEIMTTPSASTPKSQASGPRIVITGMGWVTPLGHDLETVWSKMMAGQSGMGKIDRFDAATFPTTFAAQVRNFDFRKFVDEPRIHANAGLNTQFSL